jgi:hypothetical protein
LGKIGILAKNLGKVGIFAKNLGKSGILAKNLGKMWFLEYILFFFSIILPLALHAILQIGIVMQENRENLKNSPNSSCWLLLELENKTNHSA